MEEEEDDNVRVDRHVYDEEVLGGRSEYLENLLRVSKGSRPSGMSDWRTQWRRTLTGTWLGRGE